MNNVWLHHRAMDKPDYTGVPVVVLDALRVRLSQLVMSLMTLQARVQAAELPAWPSLQKQFTVVLVQLETLLSSFQGFSSTLQHTVTYPTPLFPARTQSHLLSTLLRKKNMPEVDDSISQGITAGSEINPEADDEFCEWAFSEARNRMRLGEPAEPLPPSKPTGGWPLEKSIKLMSGQPIN